MSRISTSEREGHSSASGFTLIEMLVVLALMGVLMGISVGAFRRSVPRRDLARNAILDALRQAHLFAVAEQSPATVSFTPGDAETAPTVSATGRRIVGEWHLEGLDLSGFPQAAHGVGMEEEPLGVIGKAVRLAVNDAGTIDFGSSQSFDTQDGFACEFFMKPLAIGARTLVAKGRSFSLRSEADGGLSLEVRTTVRDEKGDPKFKFHRITTDQPVLVIDRFTKLAASFDGISVRIAADDAVAAELVLPSYEAFAPEFEQSLYFGTPDQPSACVLDEMKFGIYARTTQSLEGMELAGDTRVVRFAADGALDPLFHAGPAEIHLRSANGGDTWIRVGALGDVH